VDASWRHGASHCQGRRMQREKFLARIPSLSKDSYVHVSRLGDSYRIRAYLPDGSIVLLAEATNPGSEMILERVHPFEGPILEVDDKEARWSDWAHWHARIVEANRKLGLRG